MMKNKTNFPVKHFITAVISTGILFTPQLLAGIIDDNLNQQHTYLSYYENPHKSRGSIVGIDGFGDEYAIVWANGAVARYTEEEFLIDVFGTGNSDATGIAYVTQGAGIQGDIAVSRLSGFLTYDFEGNELQGYGIISPYDVKDIDIELGRVWVGQTGNFGYRDSDGQLIELLTGQVHSVMAVDLEQDYSDRLHVASLAGSFVKTLDINLDLLSGSISTDYITYEGFAVTDNYLFLVADDFVVKYDNPYKGYMEPVPEPATFILLTSGLAILRKKKR